MLWVLQLLDIGEGDAADSITWCHDVNGKPSFGDYFNEQELLGGRRQPAGPSSSRILFPRIAMSWEFLISNVWRAIFITGWDAEDSTS
jgi:hypothetical protein